eukprot:TRINITY_DN5566_c0_g2_i1.p2 TRINITY_DN5566_c0_g2~~TRINITY_DN5566_c0_g2_i1.p2  ORF type:complete len:262 (-),score=35.93 TRINITY_DN5566_c0_g2_i1:916-1701(-)
MQNRTDSEKGEQPTQPPMCQTNCGFFANPSCNGYCSKCYKQFFDLEQKKMLSLKTSQDPPLDSPPHAHTPLSSLSQSPALDNPTSNVPTIMSTGNNNTTNDASIVPSSTPPTSTVDGGQAGVMGQQMDVDTSVLQTPRKQVVSSVDGGSMDVDSVKVVSNQVQVIEEQQQQQQQQQEIQTTSEGKKQDVVDVPVQKNKSKCWFCTKKVGIQGVQCKCGYVFCLRHRQPEDHRCDFNFREVDRKRLATNNPRVVGSKMDHRV